MKALLKKEWISYVRENLVWLSVLLVLYLLISSSLWYTVIDSSLILCALAVSPVLGMLKDIAERWYDFEKFSFPYRQRVFSKYAAAGGYSLIAGILVLLLSHDFLSALCAVLTVLMMISICISAYFFSCSNRAVMAAALAASLLMALPLISILNMRILAQEMNHTYSPYEVPDFNPAVSLLIPAGVFLISFLFTCLKKND